MMIKYGNSTVGYGPGVEIHLTGDEVAMAIETWLLAHNVRIIGPRTIRVNDELCDAGFIYVDPSGHILDNNKIYSGRGPYKEECDDLG